jgi:hypothetical protein
MQASQFTFAGPSQGDFLTMPDNSPPPSPSHASIASAPVSDLAVRISTPPPSFASFGDLSQFVPSLELPVSASLSLSSPGLSSPGFGLLESCPLPTFSASPRSQFAQPQTHSFVYPTLRRSSYSSASMPFSASIPTVPRQSASLSPNPLSLSMDFDSPAVLSSEKRTDAGMATSPVASASRKEREESISNTPPPQFSASLSRKLSENESSDSDSDSESSDEDAYCSDCDGYVEDCWYKECLVKYRERSAQTAKLRSSSILALRKSSAPIASAALADLSAPFSAMALERDREDHGRRGKKRKDEFQVSRAKKAKEEPAAAPFTLDDHGRRGVKRKHSQSMSEADRYVQQEVTRTVLPLQRTLPPEASQSAKGIAVGNPEWVTPTEAMTEQQLKFTAGIETLQGLYEEGQCIIM